MLTEIYIEALLVDEEMADQVWSAGLIPDEVVAWAWCILVVSDRDRGNRACSIDS